MVKVAFPKTGAAALLLTAASLIRVAIPVAASAQTMDLAGNWAAKEHQDWQERVPGPEAVDYLGIPLNEEGRTVALSYMASQLSLPERQCLYYTPQYLVIGPQGFRIWADSDPVTGKVIAWKVGAAIDRSVLTIWMDGRPHPPKDAPHTFDGFTTGEWEGNILTTYTTHVKQGYTRRNGTPSSDEATVTEHFIRHGDLLTISAHIEDPIYFTEPFDVSRTWVLDPTANLPPTPAPCMPVQEVPRLDGEGAVPHYLPGQNPFMGEVTALYHIPEAVMGGAETMYPEYRKKLKASYAPPAKCIRYCCGWQGNMASSVPGCIGWGFGTTTDEPAAAKGK
jgi:hypothetical protein